MDTDNSTYLTPGSCFRDALRDANVEIPSNLTIQDWIPGEKIPAICDQLDLELIQEASVTIGIEPVIVLYETGKNKGHAVFVSDIGPLLGKVNIIGLIRLRKTDS